MKDIQNFLFLIAILLCSAIAEAQELDCNVNINSQKIQTTEKRVFETMTKDITNFLNSQQWTNDVYKPEERIKCNIQITLESGNVTDGYFEGSIQVLSVRPIFNSSYETVLLNFLDRDMKFEYRESQPMYFNENSYLSNLTSILAYYAYIIIGTDHDSFSNLGGSPYFDKARNILNAALFSAPGWDDKETNGKHWLQENYNNQLLLPYREGFYNYHRLVLDTFENDQEEKREEVLEFLKVIKQVNLLKPYALVIRSFFLAKSDEMVNIFSKGDRQIREEASKLLRELDPLNSEKYLKITRG